MKARSGEPAPTQTEKQQKNLREKTDKMFATIGALDLLMRQMNDLKDKPLVYCDDGNLLARLQSRIDAEIARAKKQVTKLEQQLGSLKSSIEGRENVNNQIRPIVEGAVKQVVKAGAAPHWTNTYYRQFGCDVPLQQAALFRPGHRQSG